MLSLAEKPAARLNDIRAMLGGMSDTGSFLGFVG